MPILVSQKTRSVSGTHIKTCGVAAGGDASTLEPPHDQTLDIKSAMVMLNAVERVSMVRRQTSFLPSSRSET